MNAEVSLFDPKLLKEILSYQPKQPKSNLRLADYMQILQHPDPVQTLELMVREDIQTQPRDFTEMAWGLYLNLSVAQSQSDANHYEFSLQEKFKLKTRLDSLSCNKR